jgi:methyltransferase-like protein/2-polyprenyl-3-methyl-5-hydroxy-6-metoxy-1,4-benzoquinol methylase
MVTEPTSYDQIPYPAGAYPQSHPDRLAALGRLFGMTPPDVRNCRVLELGCADGSNLIPLACALEHSSFVGVDLSARQVLTGGEVISCLGLKNIELRAADLRTVDETCGTFDYIIAHGLYSWVPADVQEHILSICCERLSPQGVAYVSYNTYPGWRMRGMLRDMMLYHSRKFDKADEQVQQARALINWLAETVRSENSAYGMLLRAELEQMKGWQDTYFRHDSLEETNDPIYFHEFVERAEKHGLQYLAEAEFPTMLASNLAAPVDETLNRLGRNIIEMEQYMDFVRNRMFRQTLLCHREIKLSRSLGPWSLEHLYVAAPLRPGSSEVELASGKTEEFAGPNNLKLSSGQPLVKAAVLCLAQSWPSAIPFGQLIAEANGLLTCKAIKPQALPDSDSERRILGGALLTCFARGLCEFHAHSSSFVLAPGTLPQACPLVRLQAARQNFVVNRRHERVNLDGFARHVLALLDGQLDQGAITEALTELALTGALTVAVNGKPMREREQLRKIMAGELEKKLQGLGRAALLIS